MGLYLFNFPPLQGCMELVVDGKGSFLGKRKRFELFLTGKAQAAFVDETAEPYQVRATRGLVQTGLVSQMRKPRASS